MLPNDTESEVDTRKFALELSEALGRERVPDFGPAVLRRLEDDAARPDRVPDARRRTAQPQRLQVLLAVAAALVVAVFYFLPRDDAQRPEPESGTGEVGTQVQDKKLQVRGRCLDAQGQPLARLKVDLRLVDHNIDRDVLLGSDVSDEAGGFDFEIPRPDTRVYSNRYCYLIAHGPGYATTPYSLRSPATRPDKIQIRVGKPGSVKGIVRDAQGRPIARARVALLLLDAQGLGSPTLFFSYPNDLLLTQTDADGRFELPHLPVDTQLELRADSPRHAPGRIRCRAGQDLEFELAPGGVVSGRVVLPDGKPAAHLPVRCQGVQHSGWAVTRTDAQGRYRLQSLAADAYNIWAVKKGFTVIALDSLVVEAGKRHQAPDLRIVAGGFIEGRVLGPNGAPPRDCKSLRIGIYGPSRPRSGAAIESTGVQADGSFRIRAAPGKNYVYICSEAGGRGKAVDVPAGGATKVRLIAPR